MVAPLTDERRERMKRFIANEKSAQSTESPEQREARLELQNHLTIQKARYEVAGLDWNDPVTQSELHTSEFMAKKTIDRHRAAIKQLQQQVAELKEIVGHTQKHYVFFGGNFDLDNNYNENTIVLYKGLVYIANRDIAANKADPPRQGSGWVKLF